MVGASYIHGTDGNPLSQLATTVGATLVPSQDPDSRKYLDKFGNIIRLEDQRFVFKKIWEYSDAAVSYSRMETVDDRATVQEFLTKRIDEDQEITSDGIRDLIASGLEMFSDGSGCDLDKLSLKYYWTEDDLPVFLLIAFQVSHE